MKILYITGNSPWPPTVGSRMRSYNIAQLLARQNELVVALLHGSTKEIALFEHGPHRLPGGRVVEARPPSPWLKWRNVLFERYRPVFQSKTFGTYRDGVRALVEQEEPDLLWFFRFDTVWSAGCDCYAVPVICDIDDFEAKAHRRAIALLPSVKRIAATLDYPFVVQAQRSAARTCDLLLVSNPDDVADAASMTGRPVRAAPNGYDFSTPPDYEQERQRRIVFFGALNYRPNVDGLRWFVREIWPKIREAVPDIRLDIAGAPSPAVRFLDEEPGVQLCGFVESIRSFANRAALLIVPLRMGGGTRIKILEAWALGLPVVSTTIGCEGLDAVDGETLVVADDPDSFSKACVDLVASAAAGAQMARRAFEFAMPRFDWPALAPRLNDAIESVTREKPACPHPSGTPTSL